MKRFQRTGRPDVLQMWTVYERPSDYPNDYVVREWHVIKGRSQPAHALTAPSLEQARALVPPDCIRLLPNEGDDPKIVETWL